MSSSELVEEACSLMLLVTALVFVSVIPVRENKEEGLVKRGEKERALAKMRRATRTLMVKY